MFLSLLGVTIGAGLVDSLNPIAIAQQFVLQSTAKSKHSILAYIFGIGLTNFIFGLLFTSVWRKLSEMFLNRCRQITCFYSRSH